ncbi:Protein of uncharacterised function (DUF2726) [Phocoenobacter uteri]|uniref:Protein of uncharacterized function (DUF2726) n=1 Tax=Phocoenobacter uteri TaxID=146806 RepID=A0A379CAB1_9PAST|nr:DUF2726 domain-containing protein [Phocoenobacter uteri]MDG6882512.1 hypothetical protein [Phocoenobacter uteri]SUB58675.1 Protein of uncharacterised function (DUF2726) [Phocoenobacter uteri]
MNNQQFYILLILVGIISLKMLLTSNKKRKSSKNKRLPDGKLYHKMEVMNRTEKILFYKLKKAFPSLHIFTQIPFSCIVKPASCDDKLNRRLFWKINQKRVDFLICNERLETILIIELDGASHQNKRYLDKERDEFFSKNGIRTVRFDTKELKFLTTNNIIEKCKL